MLYPHADRTPGRSNSGRAGVRLATALAVAALAANGCASGSASPQLAYSPESFVIAARAQAPDIASEDLVVPFRVSPEMVERAQYFVAGAQSDFQKADRLMRSLTDDDGFGLRYDSVATSTPEVTLERGYGNCLALTSIFIGLAREVGLAAYYVDASDRVNDLRREEAIIVDSGHIAGAVRTERGYTLIDFDGHVSRYRTFRTIDDITALAHYYNNRGFEMITEAQIAGDEVPWEDVRHSFELATKVRPDFTRAYNNLGVAHTRLGDIELAGLAYMTAIENDPKSDAAYHNLGNLRLRQDDIEGALEAYDEALRLRKRNPYLYYHRGLAQYRLGMLEEAEASFKESIALQRDYIEPRNLLAQVYHLQGREEEAAKIRAATRLILAGRR